MFYPYTYLPVFWKLSCLMVLEMRKFINEGEFSGKRKVTISLSVCLKSLLPPHQAPVWWILSHIPAPPPIAPLHHAFLCPVLGGCLFNFSAKRLACQVTSCNKSHRFIALPSARNDLRLKKKKNVPLSLYRRNLHPGGPRAFPWSQSLFTAGPRWGWSFGGHRVSLDTGMCFRPRQESSIRPSWDMQ